VPKYEVTVTRWGRVQSGFTIEVEADDVSEAREQGRKYRPSEEEMYHDFDYEDGDIDVTPVKESNS
jgi:hypothetical protein